MRRRRHTSVAIVFESHSASVDNGRWVASGWLDSPLSQLGRRQARELGQRYADVEIAAVFASDLARAADTARIAFGARGLPLFLDWRLRECDYGDLAGVPAAQVEQERRRHVYEPFPRGESYGQVVERVRGFLRDVAPRFVERRIVVVGHSATNGRSTTSSRGLLFPSSSTARSPGALAGSTPTRWTPDGRPARGPIVVRTVKGTNTAVRLPAGFAGLDPPERWPRPTSVPRGDRLAAPVETLAGVGPALRRRLGRVGIETVGDLLWQRPRRYEAPVPTVTVSELFGEDEVVLDVVVRSVSSRRRGRLSILTARVADETGEIKATWFNQPWLESRLSPGTRVRLRGRPSRYGFTVCSYDLEGELETADFAPVYPATEDLSQKKLRELRAQALRHARDVGAPLPAAVAEALGLPLRADALLALHRPRSLAEAERGRRALAFEELLVLQLALARQAATRERAFAQALPPAGELLARYRASLPFSLTPHQERAIAEIDADLARTTPMQRLLQGDVGSGKTVVALYALLRAVEAGRQGALMAPTETLAEQHFLTIDELCAPLGVRVSLLTSSVHARERRTVRQLIASGDAALVVGTHALIQKEVSFRDLAVAVVDEQHRFGVAQRSALVQGRSPHVLHLTATPIPRTLALTVYGDLDVSELTRPPADRKPIVTAWVSDERSAEAYTRLRRHLDAGRQAYVVCPLIEASEATVARAAEAEAERLREGELRGYRVGCLHGRLGAAERRAIMASFKAGELDVLVATTVIEVGVDVPNATIMIIQEADRFGLAQLHQLRGRVGRGAEQSYCLLVSRPREELTDSAIERLEAMVQTTDGFELAERDLEIRGEGHLLGAQQSGLSDLRFVRLRHDADLLERARAVAAGLEDEGLLAEEVDRLLGEAEHLGES